MQVADLYEAYLSQTEGRWVLRWNLIEERRAWREAREGAYLLRTNLEGAAVEELWTKYIQLTEAEAAFRALKSELSIRPLFHQLEPRVKAHILVAFLGYSLWVTLKHLLRRKNSDCSPAKPSRCWPPFRVRISCSRPPTVGRFACGVLRPSRLNNKSS